MPRILWIELTSKCPFDCIFCSRKTLRGAGEHMDFELYRSVIQSLDEPEIIRLNYSGESAHYPYLIEAIHLAKERGAFVELVTAFASFQLHKMEALVISGLDRLTVSLHTLDARQFQDLYRYSSVQDMKQRLTALRDAQHRLGRRRPLLDFAFVALRENLNQLPGIAAYARELGVQDIAVHPLIRRDEIPVQFPAEIEGRRLRPDFIAALAQTVAEARAEYPDLQFNPSTCELAPGHRLGEYPQYSAGLLPVEGRIFSCDQSPWDSVHILANGDVVTCEARDKVVMGNLRGTSLPEIWRNAPYQSFRRAFQEGRDECCRACPYKLAYVPGPLRTRVTAREGNGLELAVGWHWSEGNLVWSKRRSRALLNVSSAPEVHPDSVAKCLEVNGVLPGGQNGQANELTVRHRGQVIGAFVNPTDGMQAFHLSMLFLEPAETAQFDFAVSHPCRPSDAGSPDVRELGFALRALGVTDIEGGKPSGSLLPRWRCIPLYLALGWGSRLAALLRRVRTGVRRLRAWRPGISIVIPERGTPDLLAQTLASARAAIKQLGEACEVIVMVNGAAFDRYRELRQRFPKVRWLYSRKPLGFSGAVQRGVRKARFDWVYLLNSDMTLAPGALAEVARWRGPHVFAIASQIRFADAQARRQETGWTDFRTNQGMVEIFDVTPADQTTVRGHLYAGGGASLFRRQLLRRFMSRSHPYNPVYWEDVEWGLRAWRAGYEVLFCPASEAVHIHRATVSQYFEPPEVERILRRNQLLFSLRNGFHETAPREVIAGLRRNWDPRTLRELTAVRQAASLFRALLWNALAPARDVDLQRLRGKFYLRPITDARRPTVIVVSPFAVYPPAHGSARRIASLIPYLSRDFDIVLLCDEETLFEAPHCPEPAGPVAIHLTAGRVEKAGEVGGRIARIRLHSHGRLGTETQRLAAVYGASLVQIEHLELAALVNQKRNGIPWSITLHDVLFTEGRRTPEDRFEAGLIAKYDAVIACSCEDAALAAHQRVAVVPNGVECNGRPYEPSRGRRGILFMGPFRYAPNLHGIRCFLETVYPGLRAAVPGIRLQILAGRNGRSLAKQYACFDQPGVEIVDSTEDVEPWLRGCALTINPLPEMRGSSIKLVESIAAGRVCVSTIEGARGFRDLHSEALVTVPRIEDFVSPLRELLLDEERRIRVERPRESLLSSLSWEHAARVQVRLYRSCGVTGGREPNAPSTEPAAGSV